MTTARIDEKTEKTTLADNDLILIADSADLLGTIPKYKKLKGSKLVRVTDILDVLNSTSVINPLSANKGKDLQDQINALPTTSSSSKGASYTILDNDGFAVIYFTATATATLPTLADNLDREIIIYNDSTDLITVDGEGAETINAQTLVILPSQGNYIKLKATSAKWVVIDFKIDYMTGWITRTEWETEQPGSSTTLNINSNVTHNMNCDFTKIEHSFFISVDSTENNAIDLLKMNPNTTSSNDHGLAIEAVDANNSVFQTGASGVIYYTTGSGTSNILNNGDSFGYKIYVKRMMI